jgi:hypothetical protein
MRPPFSGLIILNRNKINIKIYVFQSGLVPILSGDKKTFSPKIKKAD